MAVRQIPWADLGHLPQLLWHSWTRNRGNGGRPADLAITMRWKPGPAAHAAGPYMFSLTQFTPAKGTDVPAIWLAGTSLGDQLVRLDGAVGVTTYIRPGRDRQVGSLSVWSDPSGLEVFMALPDHIEIMNKYRPRGLPVRSATWWFGDLDVDAAVVRGIRLLDTHDDRRVTLHRT